MSASASRKIAATRPSFWRAQPRQVIMFIALATCATVLFAIRLRSRPGVARESAGTLPGESPELLTAEARWRDEIERNPDAAKPYLELGRLHAKAGFLTRAIEEITECLERDPTLRDAREERLKCLTALNRGAEQIEELKWFQDQEPDNPRYYLEIADLYQRVGELDDALQTFKTLHQREPRSTAPLIGMAEVLIRLGKFTQAMHQLRAAQTIDPTSPRIDFLMGKACIYLGQIDQAMRHFQRVLRRSSAEANCWFGLGLAYARLTSQPEKDRWRKATECFEKVIAVLPQQPKAHYQLGIALFHLGKWPQAAERFNVALTLDRGLIDCRRALGETYLKMGRPEHAHAQFALYYGNEGDFKQSIYHVEAVIKHDPKNPKSYTNLATAWRNAAQPSRAIEVLEEGIRSASPKGELYHDLADMYSRERLYPKALNVVKKALVVDPGQAYRYANMMSNFYQQLAQYDEAEQALKQYAERAPDPAVAQYNLGTLYYYHPSERDYMPRAIEAFRRVLALSPLYGKAHYYLGLSLRKQIRSQESGKEDTGLMLEEAADHFRRAIDLNSGFVESYLNLGQIYLQLGKSKQGQTYLRLYEQYSKSKSERTRLERRTFDTQKLPGWHWKLGQLYEKMGLYTNALIEYRIETLLRPRFIEAHNRIAGIYLIQERLEAWEREIETIRKLSRTI